MKIGSWTVRSQDAANFLLDMKVDAIITDYPDYVDPRK
jgi:glycerophosphoryl diester phosphodiesterase